MGDKDRLEKLASVALPADPRRPHPAEPSPASPWDPDPWNA